MRPPREKSGGLENPRLLVAEDDPELGETLRELFAQRGYSVERTTSGEAALREMTSLPPYDVVLLDVMLPKRNGFDVLREAHVPQDRLRYWIQVCGVTEGPPRTNADRRSDHNAPGYG